MYACHPGTIPSTSTHTITGYTEKLTLELQVGNSWRPA